MSSLDFAGAVGSDATTAQLEAKGQDGRFIEEVFTATDTSDFSGLVRCTAEGEFAGVAVELDAGNGIFTTLPVLPVDRTVFRGGEYALDFAHFANGASDFTP